MPHRRFYPTSPEFLGLWECFPSLLADSLGSTPEIMFQLSLFLNTSTYLGVLISIPSSSNPRKHARHRPHYQGDKPRTHFLLSFQVLRVLCGLGEEKLSLAIFFIPVVHGITSSPGTSVL